MTLFDKVNIQIDGSVLERVEQWFIGIFNQPTWLKIALVASLTGAGIYFYYNHYNNREYIKELQDQVEIIKESVSENLSIDNYKEDLIYVIQEIQLLDKQEDQDYYDELLEIDLLIKFIERHHPGDPIIEDFKAMKNRLQVSHDVYDKHYEYAIIHLNKIINDNSPKK